MVVDAIRWRMVTGCGRFLLPYAGEYPEPNPKPEPVRFGLYGCGRWLVGLTGCGFVVGLPLPIGSRVRHRDEPRAGSRRLFVSLVTLSRAVALAYTVAVDGFLPCEPARVYWLGLLSDASRAGRPLWFD